jgi:hypothetical protein
MEAESEGGDEDRRHLVGLIASPMDEPSSPLKEKDPKTFRWTVW